MKKLFCLILALCLVLPLIACAKEDPQVTTTVTTTASEALKDLPRKVGVIYTGKADEADTGSHAIHEDLKKAMLQCGLDEELDVFVEELVPEITKDVLAAVDRLVDDGALIIFGTALGYNEALAEAADIYPEIIFCQMGGLNGNDMNFLTYFAPLYQSYYMMGATAAIKAMELESEAIGFISTSGKETTEAAAIINAFARGVEVYLPGATVYLRVLEPGATEDMEIEAVKDLYQNYDCQVFGAFTHTAGVLKAATDFGLYATGPWFELKEEENYHYKNQQLSSSQVRWYSFFKDALSAVDLCNWADDFAMAMETTDFYGVFHDDFLINKPSAHKHVYFELGNASGKLASNAAGALLPQPAYRVLPVIPDDPGATKGTTLVPHIIQGPFSGFFYNVTLKEYGSETTNYEASLADNEGNIRIPAGDLSLEENEIREMDYYVMGIEVV